MSLWKTRLTSLLKTAWRGIQHGVMRCVLWAEHFVSLWKIAWRSIQQRALASTLTAVSMGLAVALVVAVLVVYGVVYRSFYRGGEGYDLIVGAKGSHPLQLVLNSAYYLGDPVGTIPYSYFRQLAERRLEPKVRIEAAVPICMGHSYKGYRVVGTTPDMFDKLKYLGNKEYEFAEGSNFSREKLFDAVAGWEAARDSGLKLGSKFQAIHGVADRGGQPHEQEFEVVGILAPTGTPNDRALFVNMEGFYRIHAHEHGQGKAAQAHSPHEHEDESKEVTAILVCVAPGQAEVLARTINKVSDAQAVVPSYEIAKLFENVIGNVQKTLLIMAVLIVVVTGLGMMVSIYNSMSDRRREIAVMRALGASRVTVMIVILLESILLSCGGGVLGLLTGHGLVGVLSPMIAEQTGVTVGMLQFQTVELLLIPGLIVLAALVGYLPAVAAYRTDVARSLTATP